ncbi:28S ribosomal protein S10 [Fasciola gigantica]|uniref:Small ribosomal subunit protein uS10m n=1 Tax=Fasciola gigantica TaxID=46835 RepID=A0A504YRD9_FASGI|nr:28S ribosomal protein S10 [Fasciola gigantica]
MISLSPSRLCSIAFRFRPLRCNITSSLGLQLSTLCEGEEEKERDILYRKVVLVIKGHETGVLRSYEQFLKTVCGELSLNFERYCFGLVDHFTSNSESRNRPAFQRLSLNKSPFIYKKHQRQYEFRTYYKYFTIKEITGCTTDVFLEYVERNLPEGIAMEVIRHRLERFPEHIRSNSSSTPCSPSV